jgi:hypothetical protein
VIGKQDTYFVRYHSDSPYKYSEAKIKSMLGFLVHNMYVVFGDQVFQQSVGIPMGTNCTLLLIDVISYWYEAEFVQKLLRDDNKILAVSFNRTFMQPGFGSACFYLSVSVRLFLCVRVESDVREWVSITNPRTCIIFYAAVKVYTVLVTIVLMPSDRFHAVDWFIFVSS